MRTGVLCPHISNSNASILGYSKSAPAWARNTGVYSTNRSRKQASRAFSSIGQLPSLRRGRRDVPAGMPARRPSVVAKAAATGMIPLGFDLLTFLGSTVVVVPLFKKLKISPVLGFLLSGVVLHQLGWIRDPKDMEALSELGVLFLLFEMGLELSLDRLKALAKYAFGLGTLQMFFCTAIFSAFALPAGQGLGTHILETVAHAPTSLVSIRSVDEAVVIGGALSLSSSAFVLQLLTERGEMPTRFGSATLGILLLQDIAVVPFLVLLPLAVQLGHSPGGAAGSAAAVAAAVAHPASLVALLGPTVAKTFAGLGLLLVGGRLLLRRIFEVVAQSDNSETFVALCLLTVAGASLLTQQMGFSDTMGAFVAGVLLSESSYKTQVEADIRPFRGLLLGLFFVSTGGSINMDVLRSNWQVIGWILAGLITIKTAVVAALGPSFGLSRSESIRTGFILSQGGEFAFVLLSLASSLHVLPENLNQVLIIVVVLSMALTPGLAQAGGVVGDWVENALAPRDAAGNVLQPQGSDEDIRRMAHHGIESPVVICGFGPHGQILAALLDQPFASLPDPTSRSYIAFDLDPARVQAAREAGFNVVYGDGSRSAVLKAAGVEKPCAIAVCLTSNKVAAHRAVASLRTSYPSVPLFALGADIRDAAELEEAGADRCVMASTAVGVSLGTEILQRLGASTSEAAQVGRDMEAAMTLKAHGLSEQVARYGASVLETEGCGVVLVGRTRYRKSFSSSSSLDGAEAEMLASIDYQLSTPAPPDSLPSMEGAMPAHLRNSNESGSASSNGSSNGTINGNGNGSVSTSNGTQITGFGEGSRHEIVEVVAAVVPPERDVENGPVLEFAGSTNQSDRQPPPAVAVAGTNGAMRNRIAATATAYLDCGDDVECKAEDVAEIVVVDASRQQMQAEAAAAKAGRMVPAVQRTRSPKPARQAENEDDKSEAVVAANATKSGWRD